MRKPGFTLIELMIVVAIIATLIAIAIPSLIRSRIAANESATVSAAKAFGSAEDIYRRTDWDKDGILEYASRIYGPKSLFTDGNGNEINMVDKAFALAEGTLGVGTPVIPKSGYVFWVLTAQGNNAAGRAKSYFAYGRMVLGYGLSAIPFDYDTSGRSTYSINNTGTVYQKDFGLSIPTHLTIFDPDSTWVPAE